MKKLIAGLMVGLMVLAVTAPAADAAAKGAGRGGFVGFIAGCCFGIRSGSAFNDGKEIHFREWCRLDGAVTHVRGETRLLPDPMQIPVIWLTFDY